LPGGLVSKGAKAADVAAEASKLAPVAKTAAKIASRAALEGAGAATVATAQSGNVKEGAKTGAVVGGISGALGAASAALKPVRTQLSEKLYSQIFKNSYDDMTQMLKTGALQDLQKTNPQRFQELVKEGIIKADANGAVKFNPTLAREALDRGLRGSIKNMSNEVVRKSLDLEQQARTIASEYGGTVGIPEPNKMLNILKTFQTEYKDTYLSSKVGDNADQLVQAIVEGKGKLSGEDALKLRRFLDSMRLLSSYKENTHVSLSQQNLREASDLVRASLNKIPGMSPVMNNYRFYIEALESLAKEAAKRGNSAVINLIDTALFGFGGGLAGPQGAAVLPLTRRALTLPKVVTELGSKLDKGSTGTVSKVIKASIASQVPNKQ
jgi:hypothetical protein